MTARRLTELGLAVGALGALIMAFGAYVVVRGQRSYGGASDGAHRREKVAYMVGSLLIAAGFLLMLLGTTTRSVQPTPAPSPSVSSTT